MRTDLDELQGTWTVTALETDGRQMPEVLSGDAKIVVTGNGFTSIGMGTPYEGRIELGETKTPKAFDLLITAGHAAGTRHAGIYKLDGDRWTMCFGLRGGKRPRTFAAKSGSGLVLQTLERGDAARTPKPTSKKRTRSEGAIAGIATSGNNGRAEPATVLEGEWTMVAGVFNGAAMGESMIKWCKRVTRGNVTTVLAGPRVMLKARFALDSAERPRAVDYVILEGADTGKTQAGIFEMRDDTLRVCMAPPGKPRPTDFSSKKGDGRSYTTWRFVTR